MRFLAHALVLTVLSSLSSSAFALVSGELSVGKRWYEFEDSDGEKSGNDGQVIHVGVHVDPIPLVPVSLGLSVDTVTLDPNDYSSYDVDTAGVFEVGLEVKAWVPMVPVVTPYAKLSYTLASAVVTKGTVSTAAGDVDYATAGELSGYHLNIGAEMSVIPLMSILFEVGMGSQEFKLTEVEQDGSKSEPNDSNPANSQSFLIGLKVGI